MVSMDKTDIAKYLRDYAVISELIRSYPNIKIDTLYRNYMISNGRIEEYQENSFIKMVRVYAFITELRIFSFIEDISIDFLNENDLDFDDIKSKIFANPEDAKSFSKKQIIRYIRNAFNHNDNDAHSKYNISVNGRYLEIDLLDVRKEKDKLNDPQNNKPFHIKIDGKQLQRIREEALKKNHNLVVGNIDYDAFDFDKPFENNNTDNLEFVRIYFDKKVDLSIINALWNSGINEKNNFQEKIDLLVSILGANNYTDFHISRYPLSNEQKEKLKNLLKNIQNLDIEKINKEVLFNSIQHLFADVIPLGMFHFNQLCYEQQFASWFMDPNLSFNEIEIIIKNGLMGKEYVSNKSLSEEYLAFDKERYEMLSNIPNKYLIDQIMFQRDYNSRVKYPIALYLGYISDSLNNEAQIEINGTKYDSVHIRDSFVHGRWFFGEKDTIELYDCESGNNDYNFNWNVTIGLHELLSVMDSIYNTRQMSSNKKL